MRRNSRFPILATVVALAISGCASPPSTSNPTEPYPVHAAFRDHLEHGRHYEACLLIDAVQYELRDLQEGAAGFEHQLLVGLAAGSGHEDWTRIFTSLDIPLHLKVDIVSEIDLISRHGN